jgi:hypothetical protein
MEMVIIEKKNMKKLCKKNARNTTINTRILIIKDNLLGFSVNIYMAHKPFFNSIGIMSGSMDLYNLLKPQQDRIFGEWNSIAHALGRTTGKPLYEIYKYFLKYENTM